MNVKELAKKLRFLSGLLKEKSRNALFLVQLSFQLYPLEKIICKMMIII